MKRLVCLFFIILSFPALAFAEWSYIPLDELVQDSDLLVVGKLHSASEHTKDGVDYGQGVITVSDVIWGKAVAGEQLSLKWQNTSGLICPRVRPQGNEDKEGIWLLTVNDDGTVGANYPGRFVDLKERGKIESILASKPISVRTRGSLVSPAETFTFWLVFRNFSAAEKRFPGIEYQGGSLALGPGSKLECIITSPPDYTARPSQLDRVAVSENLPPLVVQPNQEIRIKLDLKAFLASSPLDGEYYALKFRAKGHGSSNSAHLYVRTPKERSERALPASGAQASGPETAQASRPAYSGTRGVLAFLAALALYRRLYGYGRAV